MNMINLKLSRKDTEIIHFFIHYLIFTLCISYFENPPKVFESIFLNQLVLYIGFFNIAVVSFYSFFFFKNIFIPLSAFFLFFLLGIFLFKYSLILLFIFLPIIFHIRNNFFFNTINSEYGIKYFHIRLNEYLANLFMWAFYWIMIVIISQALQLKLTINFDYIFIVTYLIFCFLYFFTSKFHRLALIILSGLLLNYSMPPYNLYLFSFISFIPYLFIMRKFSSYREALFYNFLLGFNSIIFGFYWLYLAVMNFSDIPELMSAGFMLFYAFACSYRYVIAGMLAYFFQRFTLVNVIYIYPIAFGFVEYFFIHYLNGDFFPWYISNSQYKNYYLTQIIDIIGLPGLTIYILIVNVFLYQLWIYLFKYLPFFQNRSKNFIICNSGNQNTMKKGIILSSIFFVVSIISIYAYGFYREQEFLTLEKTAKKINVAVLQTNLYDVQYGYPLRRKFEKLILKLHQKAKNEKKVLDLILWPESPAWLHPNGELLKLLIQYQEYLKSTRIAFSHNLISSIPVEFSEFGEKIYHNKVTFYSKDGKEDFYNKLKLFPFGEYVPIVYDYPSKYRGKIYSFFKIIFFEKGTGAKAIVLDNSVSEDEKVHVGLPVCYEAIVSNYISDFKRDGANIILNSSNDSWYGVSSGRNIKDYIAPTKEAYFHLVLSSFRAIENRLPLVRGVNSGITTYIDVLGKSNDETKTYQEDEKIYTVPIIHYPMTLFTKYGEYYSILLLIFMLCVFLFRRSFKNYYF